MQIDETNVNEPEDSEVVESEAEAAGAEAARIGGEGTPEGEDPAERPLREAGQGEAEGFEDSEERLADVASHGDQHRFPGRDSLPPEEATDAAFGEADEPLQPDS